ncbi:MAG: DNA-directed RNA polymerase subunit beta' [Clostridia bacterium]|nr:DNA-directed RNA polymerase subunit beta' [Clostridia bacterium]
MSEEKNLSFKSIQIGLASPDTIRSWAVLGETTDENGEKKTIYGEVTKPETINYRTLKPEIGGLFCERIFGPTKDWECHCGKYKRIRYKGKVCERCGVEVTRAKVRRERMGIIELAAPVSHIWYFKTIPSRMGLVLDVSPKALEHVLYFSKYIVTDPGVDTGEDLYKYQILDEKTYSLMREKYGDDFKAGMGAETIKELLIEIGDNIDTICAELRAELEKASGQKRTRISKRLEVLDAFRQSGNRPEWMILDVIPVIPPDLRPMVQLDGGRFATSDLNDLYRRVINRNNRLKRLLELGAPEIIVRNEKRMLQEAVDALIDNGRRGKPVTGPNNRSLKSLSDMLKGKQGRFRQNLLGKRVDYSGRSVIVVGPELQMYQCGVPKEMALELFKPFIMKRLVETKSVTNIKTARKMVERASAEVWDALELVIKEHPVLLNRAPTLHRLGIQAFEPVLVEGKALKLHPLVCTAYNADFDGDQMAIHVPLSAEAQAEARFLMLAANNLLKPADGKPVAVPSQDMVLGCYYLTLVKSDEPGTNKVFRDKDEAMMAYNDGVVGLHAPIRVRMTNAEGKSALVWCTVGFLIFNEQIPQDLGFVDRTKPENEFNLEWCFSLKDADKKFVESNDDIKQNKVGKKQLGKIIERCIDVHGTSKSSIYLDKIKATGFKFSTKGAITVAVIDAVIPEEKKNILAEAEKKIDAITKNYRRGLINDAERRKHVIEIWNNATEDIAGALKGNLDEFNPIFMMADSGARGSMSQIRQLAGMRGLIANTAGEVIEVPIRANYREGLNILEYFISSRGARKGLADTALRTADSGYLTRRLVDVSQDVIVRDVDCGTTEGLEVFDIKDGNHLLESLEERLVGRYLLEDAVHPETGEVICANDHMMTKEDAKRIVDAGIERIKIRSILTCHSHHGVCQKCYGANLATNKPVTVGEAVGIVAAQSIGEPGTQLTMRTFHTGGVAGGDVADVTQGLPRVEELFEARRPKACGLIAKIDGRVRMVEEKRSNCIVITNEETMKEEKVVVLHGSRTLVNDGDYVKAGDLLVPGAKYPQDILEAQGPQAVQEYIIAEIQNAYRTQGVDINDKHIEVIIRQMMRKLRVIDAGSTDLITGSTYEYKEIEDANKVIQARIDAGEEGLKLATYHATLLGITKASLATESFMSAASFQETTRVLTEAAIKGKVDSLFGLKENVIIGQLIPAGTGMKHPDINPDPIVEEVEAIETDMMVEETQESIEE